MVVGTLWAYAPILVMTGVGLFSSAVSKSAPGMPRNFELYYTKCWCLVGVLSLGAMGVSYMKSGGFVGLVAEVSLCVPSLVAGGGTSRCVVLWGLGVLVGGWTLCTGVGWELGVV